MEPVHAAAGTKPGRKWYQFGIKTLLLLTLLVAAFFSGRATLQRELVRLRAEAERLRAIAEEQREVAERERYEAARALLVAQEKLSVAERARIIADEARAAAEKARFAAEQLRFQDDSAVDGLLDATSGPPLHREQGMKIDAIERALRFDYQRRCRKKRIPAAPFATPVLMRFLEDLPLVPST